MPRLKIGFILKVGTFIVFLLLLGPYLFHLKLSREIRDDAEEYRIWQLQQKEMKTKDPHVMEKLRSQTNQTDRKRFVQKHLEERKEKAVLISGVRGNFEPPEPEIKDRPGENGKAVALALGEKAMAQNSVREYGFNMVASGKVAMDRVIPDTRLKECKFWKYPEKLPDVSVILVFHNEGFTTLVRTIHSVINTSPPQFLKEIVLVDDFSTKVHLKRELEDYIKQFGDKVKLYRNTKREGLIRTRTRGAELSTGEVIVFLDAHCECNRNWLVPLLNVIKQNRTTMAVPIVDGIEWDNMAYQSVYSGTHHRGIFEWGFLYKEGPVPKKELDSRQHFSEPYRSPTHAGGLFAMDRKYFFELGGYDPGLNIWGGENYELSFKIWQCGGSIVWVPCSRVGHIYRNIMPYGYGKDVDPRISPIFINYMRVVEVWLEGEFKEYFYTREPNLRGFPFGNITSQLQFKKDHKCKDFRWFMENVAYDVYDQFPKLPPNEAWGEIRQRGDYICWDSGWQQVGGEPITTSNCDAKRSSQLFRLNMRGQIGYGERCILAQNADTLHVSYCSRDPVGPWDWDQDTGLIRHKEHNKCVSVGTDYNLHLQFCNVKSKSLKWDINEVYHWKS